MSNRPTPSPPSTWGTDVLLGLLLLATIGSSVGLGVVYLTGGQVQLEGLFLGAGLGALAVAVGVWAKRFMPSEPAVEARPVLESSAEDREAVAAELDRGERTVARRRVLATMLAAAVGSIVAAVALPLRSLGPFPLPSLRHTAWGRGTRLVDEDGRPVRVSDVPVDALVTVYPEGDLSEEAKASSQTILLRLGAGVSLGAGREEWSPEGLIAFSKVCTHAGCPVGLYQSETHQLVCPCHQSLFDVTDGARPVFGPASRPLPQLPLAIRNGFIVASDDYQEPVGPGYWSRDRGGS